MSNNLIQKLAALENISLKNLRQKIGHGKVVIVKNKKRKIKPLAIGEGVRIKINANLGTSTKNPLIKDEIKKLKVAQASGADTVMDLSVGGDLGKIRKKILDNCLLPVGTVPIYEAAIEAEAKYGSFEHMSANHILKTIEHQAQQGVDFFTIHAGITKSIIENSKLQKRKGGIVSRGGAIISRWIIVNKKENPLYEYFDQILDIAKKYNIVLSLGDGLRPGAISDSLDNFQIQELLNLGILTKKALKKGVQIIIEGPGHVPINQIEANVRLEKEICNQAPFYVLGPLVTDTALGFDHISSAIGGALASLYGADFLCVVTPKEHLGHPDAEDIKRGVIAARIAAHSVDLTRNPKFRMVDDQISYFRKKRDWKKHISLSIYPKEAKKIAKGLKLHDTCSMCGEYCSLKMMENCLLV